MKFMVLSCKFFSSHTKGGYAIIRVFTYFNCLRAAGFYDRHWHGVAPVGLALRTPFCIMAWGSYHEVNGFIHDGMKLSEETKL